MTEICTLYDFIVTCRSLHRRIHPAELRKLIKIPTGEVNYMNCSNRAELTPEEVKEISRFEEAFKTSFNKEIVLIAFKR